MYVFAIAAKYHKETLPQVSRLCDLRCYNSVWVVLLLCYLFVSLFKTIVSTLVSFYNYFLLL